MSTIRLLRRLRRLVGIAAVTCVCYFPLVAVSPLLARRPRRRRAWHRFIMRWWSRGVLRAAGVTVERRGEAPEPPYLLVANHLSYLDILVLGSTAGAIFVAKAEIAGWPVGGALCRGVGTIFIDRSSRRDLLRVGVQVERALAQGAGVALFPEGTTSRGDGLLPFRSSALAVAASSALPVHWALLSYHAPGAPDSADDLRSTLCWNEAPFAGHLLDLLALPRVEARVVFGEEPVREPDRKRLATELRRRMEESFEPTG